MIEDSKLNLNEEVSQFLDLQKHPFRNEIERLRILLLSAHSGLIENIKWNGPNYSFENEDRITMRIQPPKKQVQLIFHRGAKKQIQPENRLISDESKLMEWKENDRAIVTIKSLVDIEDKQNELIYIVKAWISDCK
jgi:hypothetical protein